MVRPYDVGILHATHLSNMYNNEIISLKMWIYIYPTFLTSKFQKHANLVQLYVTHQMLQGAHERPPSWCPLLYLAFWSMFLCSIIFSPFTDNPLPLPYLVCFFPTAFFFFSSLLVHLFFSISVHPSLHPSAVSTASTESRKCPESTQLFNKQLPFCLHCSLEI